MIAILFITIFIFMALIPIMTLHAIRNRTLSNSLNERFILFSQFSGNGDVLKWDDSLVEHKRRSMYLITMKYYNNLLHRCIYLIPIAIFCWLGYDLISDFEQNGKFNSTTFYAIPACFILLLTVGHFELKKFFYALYAENVADLLTEANTCGDVEYIVPSNSLLKLRNHKKLLLADIAYVRTEEFNRLSLTGS
tara:strand:+ start:534 stop:1112 length:579 start_codon:yes stop_codon:yes gene_type:complete